MDVYLINLERSPDRLARMTKRLEGIPFKRIEAYDGRSDPPHNGLSGTEIACISSHMKAWKTLLSSDRPYACILEDDAVLSDDFRSMIVSDDWLPRGFDIVKIDTHFHRCLIEKKTSQHESRCLHRLRSTHLGAAAYIISRKGAENMLLFARPKNEPLDYWLFGQAAGRRFAIYQMVPALCRQEDYSRNGSTIGEERDMRRRLVKTRAGKLWREMVRPIYQCRDFFQTERWKTTRTEIDFR